MERLDVDLSDINHQLKLHKLSYIYLAFKFYEFKKILKFTNFTNVENRIIKKIN